MTPAGRGHLEDVDALRVLRSRGERTAPRTSPGRATARSRAGSGCRGTGRSSGSQAMRVALLTSADSRAPPAGAPDVAHWRNRRWRRRGRLAGRAGGAAAVAAAPGPSAAARPGGVVGGRGRPPGRGGRGGPAGGSPRRHAPGANEDSSSAAIRAGCRGLRRMNPPGTLSWSSRQTHRRRVQSLPVLDGRECLNRVSDSARHALPRRIRGLGGAPRTPSEPRVGSHLPSFAGHSRWHTRHCQALC